MRAKHGPRVAAWVNDGDHRVAFEPVPQKARLLLAGGRLANLKLRGDAVFAAEQNGSEPRGDCHERNNSGQGLSGSSMESMELLSPDEFRANTKSGVQPAICGEVMGAHRDAGGEGGTHDLGWSKARI